MIYIILTYNTLFTYYFLGMPDVVITKINKTDEIENLRSKFVVSGV